MRKTKSQQKPVSYASIGAFADAMGWRDVDLANYLGCSTPEANKLRHGKTFKIGKPVRYSRQCRVPLANLIAPEMPESQS